MTKYGLQLSQDAGKQAAIYDLIAEHGVVYGWGHKWHNGHGIVSVENTGFLTREAAERNKKTTLIEMGYTVPKWWQWWRWGERVPDCMKD